MRAGTEVERISAQEPAAAAIPPAPRRDESAVTTRLVRLLIPFALLLFVAAAFTSVAVAQTAKQPDTVVLKGSPLGGVKFNHAVHSKQPGVKCDACHHASKPEKPMKAAQQKCTDCHTKVATPPMKTKTQAAFHDPMAKKGVCVDCHQKAAAAGNKKAPAKCGDCHKKENA
ncbi:MAG TPA: cytochrome c3 family protein [Burkholderiales bacterium]|nr:cytochrome c3 family protein [Burkholderiales bacterium]